MPTAAAAARSRSCGWRRACCCSPCRRRPWARRFRSRRDGWSASRRSAAQDAGGLYAANTLGAAIGAVLAGFVLIPALGLSGSTWVGVALNVDRGGRRLRDRADCRHRHRHRRSEGAGLQSADAAQRQAEKRRLTTVARLRRSRSRRSPNAADGRSWLAAARARRLRLCVAHAAGRVDAAARPDPRPHHLRLQHRRRDLHRRPRRRRGDWRAARRARAPAGDRTRDLPAGQRRPGDRGGVRGGLGAARPWPKSWRARAPSSTDVLVREVVLVAALLLPMTLAFGAAFPFAVAAGSRPAPTKP